MVFREYIVRVQNTNYYCLLLLYVGMDSKSKPKTARDGYGIVIHWCTKKHRLDLRLFIDYKFYSFDITGIRKMFAQFYGRKLMRCYRY